MPLLVNGVNITDVKLDGSDLNTVNVDGVTVWTRATEPPEPLGNKAIGDIVKITVGGVVENFIVIHQGRPNANYENAFIGGTFLLREDVLANRQWHNSQPNNSYQASAIHTWLNNTYLNSIAQNIRDQIRQVRIPFVPIQGPSTTVNSGNNGLSCRVFLLSMTEVGYSASFSTGNIAVEGGLTSYFISGTGTEANNRRIGRRAGSAANWWLRSPAASTNDFAWNIGTSGTASTATVVNTMRGPRPAFVLPNTLLVAADGTILA
jgi:hypothetical protein